MNIHEQVKATPQVIENCLKNNAIIDNDTGKEFNYLQLIKHPKHHKIWNKSFANELGRLSQGAGGRVEVTDTMFFITPYQVPRDRLKDVSYGCIVVDYRLQK